MLYYKPLGIMFDPRWIIILQSILAIVLVESRQLSLAYILVVLLPALVLILYSLVINKLWDNKTLVSHISVSNVVVNLSIVLIFFIALANLLVLNNIVGIYGGINRAIDDFGSIPAVTKVQRNITSFYSLLFTFNYFLTVLIIPVILGLRAKKAVLVLSLPIFLLFLVTTLYGARVLFIDVLVSTALSLSLLSSYKTSKLIKYFIAIVFSIFGLASLQAARENNNLSHGFSTIGSYFSVSISNGARVINNNNVKQPLYWTLRPTFSLPFVSKALGTESVYEGIFGKIPIKSREDDFSYAVSLGANANYNTFGIYGYSFLDAGMWSIFLLCFSYLFIFIIYKLYINLNLFGVIIFPGMYSLLLDQLRTNSIFSIRSVYFIAMSLFLYWLHYVTIHKPRKS